MGRPEPPLRERVRAAVAAVAGAAVLVRIDHAALDELAGRLDPTPPPPFPEERSSGSRDDVIRSIVAWNAVNFGSGWFPHLAKEPGMSGARTLATRWQARCAGEGAPSVDWLASATLEQVAEVFGQATVGPAGELMGLFRDAWHELAAHVRIHHGGSVTTMVDAAGSAGALADELVGLPMWCDVHRLGDLEVPLGKRAQIVSSHLGAAGVVAFDDLHRLTAFADNLVPHVLKVFGVLDLDPALDARIEAGDLLVHGEPAEVELRAMGVHAIELLVDRLRDAGHDTTPAAIDHRLWQLGQDPTFKSRPRHRCRCTAY